MTGDARVRQSHPGLISNCFLVSTILPEGSEQVFDSVQVKEHGGLLLVRVSRSVKKRVVSFGWQH